MSPPRQVLPGATYLVTRRCSQRQFLLRPSRSTTSTFLYLLAVAARRYGVRVHAFCVLSNHYHLVVTDPHARLPRFQQFLDALLARAVNASLGRWESFWAPDTFSAVRLATPADVLAKVAYVLANPVAAGLVRFGKLWPGAWSAPDRIGGDPVPVQRPAHFFDPAGSMPKMESVALEAPDGFASADAFREQVALALADLEQKAREVRAEFLGTVRVLQQKPSARPRAAEPRRGLKPRVAARDKWKRAEVLGRLVEFLESYRGAWAAWRRGDRGVVFPAGTYQLRVDHGAPCAVA